MKLKEYKLLGLGDFFWMEDRLCTKMTDKFYMDIESGERKELVKTDKIQKYRSRKLTGDQMCKEVIKYWKIVHKDGRKYTPEELWNNDKNGNLSHVFELYWAMRVDKRRNKIGKRNENSHV